MTSNWCRTGILASALVVISSQTLSAQAAATRDRATYWGFLALGAAGAADSGFYASAIGGAWQKRHLILMARASSAATKKRVNRVEDVGVLAGVATRPGPLHFSVAAGLSSVRDIGDSTALGFPVEVSGAWRFTRWTGLGVRVFSVANKLVNYGGLTVALEVGRLK
jgi:hypothetical protein